MAVFTWLKPRRLSPGAAGWLSVGAVVVAAELMDARTMSEAFSAAVRHPVGGPLIITGWALLSAHLFGVIPEKYDPVHTLASKVLPRRRH